MRKPPLSKTSIFKKKIDVLSATVFSATDMCPVTSEAVTGYCALPEDAH